MRRFDDNGLLSLATLIARIEQRLERIEQGTPTNNNSSKWSSPVVLTILGGVVAVFGAIGSEYAKWLSASELERQKSQQTLLLKVIETGDSAQASKNLIFLVNAGLIDSLDKNKILEFSSNPALVPVLPNAYSKASGFGSKVPSGIRKIEKIIVADSGSEGLGKELEGLAKFKVSYHYLVDKDGQVYNLIDESRIAFHTSNWNETSIGIALIHNYGDGYPKDQLKGLKSLIVDICKRHKLLTGQIVPKSQVSAKKMELDKNWKEITVEIGKELANNSS